VCWFLFQIDSDRKEIALEVPSYEIAEGHLADFENLFEGALGNCSIAT
jgi:hypothetical protein